MVLGWPVVESVFSHKFKHVALLWRYRQRLTYGINPNRRLSSDVSKLPAHVKEYVETKAALCQPDRIYVCDGSESENKMIMQDLQKSGCAKPLASYDNCWLVRTDPADVARVESRTVISTPVQRETLAPVREGLQPQLANWLSPVQMDDALRRRFPGCMKGRTMYVVPFSMGPVGGPLSKIGIELTDSPYVVASMRVMTRMGRDVLELAGQDFVRALHSVGVPVTAKSVDKTPGWPCNPNLTLISHIPDHNEICSFGSGYGGNSLLGKKCFALRLGSILARREGFLAEHMLIVGITNPAGQKRYIAAAFPSACGKTNLAMLQPTLPGYKVECVGDDIAWMRFDANGQLRAINPESGFFGVAPGTSMKTNPNAMLTANRNTIFTNVASTDCGRVFWEGLEKEVDTKTAGITDWTGQRWTPGCGRPAAHPNSRFCAPAHQCPIIDPAWEDPAGVPIDAILFGGRRPTGVPLVYESLSWQHGVMVGAGMRSEATAAAEHAGTRALMHDPFAMRPFFGYNFGKYLEHWLSFEKRQPAVRLPRIFHVNWFRRDPSGRFLWPGFGENIRVLDWVLRRVDGKVGAKQTPIGYLPEDGDLNISGLDQAVDMPALLHLPPDFWLKEVTELRDYLDGQVGSDLPKGIRDELDQLELRVKNMSS